MDSFEKWENRKIGKTLKKSIFKQFRQLRKVRAYGCVWLPKPAVYRQRGGGVTSQSGRAPLAQTPLALLVVTSHGAMLGPSIYRRAMSEQSINM